METADQLNDLAMEYEQYFSMGSTKPAWVKDYEEPVEWGARLKTVNKLMGTEDEEEEEDFS